MGDIIKINLKQDENNKRNWDLFVEKCLSTCVSHNIEDSVFKWLFRYDCDSIEISNSKEVDGLLQELKSVSLEKEEYMVSSSSDKDIIDRLTNTIKYSPNR